MKLFINGRAALNFDNLPYSEALIRGDGAFETILVVDKNPIAIDRHLNRLAESLEGLRVDFVNFNEIRGGISQICSSNIGQSKMRLVVLSNSDWFVSLEKLEDFSEPINLTKFEPTIYSQSPLTGIKSTSYGLSLLARRQIRSLGFTDCLFINERGHVVESSFSNLLIQNGSKWSTPALSTGCLPGIVRGLLIEWFDVEEVEIPYENLLNSEALYLTSSLRLIQRVDRLDNIDFNVNSIGRGLVTEFGERLMSNINP